MLFKQLVFAFREMCYWKLSQRQIKHNFCKQKYVVFAFGVYCIVKALCWHKNKHIPITNLKYILAFLELLFIFSFGISNFSDEQQKDCRQAYCHSRYSNYKLISKIWMKDLGTLRAMMFVYSIFNLDHGNVSLNIDRRCNQVTINYIMPF